MLFNSVEFLIFFPAVCILYFIIPHRVRYLFLLVCSYYFYMCWNPEYAFLILTSTVITYLSGLLIEKSSKTEDERKRSLQKKWCVALSFASNLGILFFFKYYGFAAKAVTSLFGLFHVQIAVPAIDVILPVGISFYTFQALSYTVDVYREEIGAEKNFFKYALFVSFFPQLVAGPIERSKNLLRQVSERHYFSWERVKNGLLLMLFGYFQKVVLSSYLAMVVDSVYDRWQECTGYQLVIATVCFAFQIYCDFGGYSNIAIGAAQVMGFSLMENFNTPYLSQSVAEFWRRWHISLSTWFRDYLYIPLGGNRKGKLRKHLNIMAVFLLSGLWHGAEWHFVAWGGVNGLYQIIGDCMSGLKKKTVTIFRVDVTAASHKLLCMLGTFVLVGLSWVFFRASSLRDSIGILGRIFGIGSDRWFTWGTNITNMGLTGQTLNVLLVALSILVLSDICKYRGIIVREWILKQGIWLRWLLLFGAIFGILIFGIYGPGYDAAEFIYFQF